MPSVSRSEAELADRVAKELSGHAHLEVARVGDNVVARTLAGRPTRLVLAGHLDTVPAAGNATPRRDGSVLHGLGSADMKGGVAVLLALAELAEPASDCTYVLYAREEIDRAESGLLELEASRPDLLRADAAVLLEPTAARVEAGCQGVLKARVLLRGRRAHVARPWVGRNAIHRLGALLTTVAGFGDRRPVIGGCEYRESLQVVQVVGGGASNVVPDEASALVVYRFAPDKAPEQALDALRDLLAPAMEAGDELTVLDTAPAAPPRLDHPALEALVAASGRPATAKLAWTDVAFFAERGVPAANFGPGDPLLAHAPDERVTAADLAATYQALAAVLGRPLAARSGQQG